MSYYGGAGLALTAAGKTKMNAAQKKERAAHNRKIRLEKKQAKIDAQIAKYSLAEQAAHAEYMKVKAARAAKSAATRARNTAVGITSKRTLAARVRRGAALD
jgi:S-adenosylmethionine:tRNA-ribosyltransferase-isomerase (queuine synthetase)